MNFVTKYSANYSIKYSRENDGRWVAEIPEVPGCLAYGWSRSEAKMNALELYENIQKENKPNAR